MQMTELFRYIAVHNPIDYNQSMNDAGAIKRRLCKYLLPVLAASILFNVPKFLEGTFFSVTRMVKKSYRKKSFFFLLIKNSVRVSVAFNEAKITIGGFNCSKGGRRKEA